MEERGLNAPGGEEERAQRLYEQADVLKRAAGIDVMEAFEAGGEAQEKVKSGEWDFADVAKAMLAGGGAPGIARSANGGMGGRGDVRGMSQAEFERLNEQLDRGYTFSV